MHAQDMQNDLPSLLTEQEPTSSILCKQKCVILDKALPAITFGPLT